MRVLISVAVLVLWFGQHFMTHSLFAERFGSGPPGNELKGLSLEFIGDFAWSTSAFEY
jgi:hypothetical protein